jgi:hypothetical protein
MTFAQSLRLTINFFFMSVCVSAALSAPAQTARGEAAVLTVVNGSSEHNFGAIRQCDASVPVSHLFILKNASTQPLILDKLTPNCECASATIAGEKPQSLPVTIAPGAEISIETKVNISKLYPGLFHKAIYLFVKEQTAPAFELKLTGEIRAGVTLVSDIANFGHALYGEQPSTKIEAIVDKGVISQPEKLTAESSNPDVIVKRSVSITKNTNLTRVEFRAALSPTARIGRIAGQITLRYPGAKDISGLVGTPIQIMGDVVGSISASPQSISFEGAVSSPPAEQVVIVTGLGASSIARAKIESTSPHIKAKFIAPKEASLIKALKLQVSLIAITQPFGKQENITITAPDGERLLIPVTINIAAQR